jgi:hypothetical protein
MKEELHYRLALMLDHKFKNLRLIFLLWSMNMGWPYLKSRKSLFFMLLKSFHHCIHCSKLKLLMFIKLMKIGEWIF